MLGVGWRLNPMIKMISSDRSSQAAQLSGPLFVFAGISNSRKDLGLMLPGPFQDGEIQLDAKFRRDDVQKDAVARLFSGRNARKAVFEQRPPNQRNTKRYWLKCK